MKHVFRFLLTVAIGYGYSGSLSAQWVQTGVLGGGGPNIKSLAAAGKYLFAGTDSGVFVSTDEGATWTLSNTGLTDTNVPSLAVNDSEVFAGTHDGVFYSTDHGATWSPANSGPMQNTDAASLLVKGSDLFVGTFGNGILLSSDGGSTWATADSGLTNLYVFCLTASGGNILAGTTIGVFLSTNNGASWNAILNGWNGPWGYNVRALTVSNGYLYAGVDANDGSNSIYRSTDNGETWSILGGSPSGTTTYAFAVSGTNVFAGGDGGVDVSTDNGATWTMASTSEFPTTIISALVVSDTNLYAGTSIDPPIGVFRRPLSQMVTGIGEEGNTTPRDYSLSQNYPNPFNPSTVIRYQLPANAFVTLKVYDILGREVRTLVDERQNAGIHSVTFSASGLTSGVYFYRIETGTYHDAKKLLLLK
jgi:hypothetical protein